MEIHRRLLVNYFKIQAKTAGKRQCEKVANFLRLPIVRRLATEICQNFFPSQICLPNKTAIYSKLQYII